MLRPSYYVYTLSFPIVTPSVRIVDQRIKKVKHGGGGRYKGRFAHCTIHFFPSTVKKPHMAATRDTGAAQSAPTTMVTIVMPFPEDEDCVCLDGVKVLVPPFPCRVDMTDAPGSCDVGGQRIVPLEAKVAERGVNRELLKWMVRNLLETPLSQGELGRPFLNGESVEEIVRILHGWNLWTEGMEAFVKCRLKDEWQLWEENLYGCWMTNVPHLIASAKKAVGIRGFEVDGMAEMRKEGEVVLARLVEHRQCALDMEGRGREIRVEMEEVPTVDVMSADYGGVRDTSWVFERIIRDAARKEAGVVSLVLTDLEEDLARHVWELMNTEDVSGSASKRRKLEDGERLECNHHVTVIVDMSNYEDVADACVA